MTDNIFNPEPTNDHSGQRLLTHILLASGVHALVLLGLTFAPPLVPTTTQSPTVDITLINATLSKPPQDTNRLAAQDQTGGGNTQTRQPDQQATSAVTPTPRDGLENAPDTLTETSEKRRAALAPDTAPATNDRMLASALGHFAVRYAPHSLFGQKTKKMRLARRIDIRQRIQYALDEFTRDARIYSQNNPVTQLSPTARKGDAVEYKEGWRRWMQHLGNLYYPHEAMRRNLSGTVHIAVAIHADGTLKNMRVLESSGQPILDAAALRITKLGRRYDPFPPALKQTTDVLVFSYEWRFGQ